jgi:hypothetical protein
MGIQYHQGVSMTTATYRQLYRPKPGVPAWMRRVWTWF